MNRKLFFLCVGAFLATANASAQTTYFSTNFDGGMPATFTLHDVDGRTPSTDMANLGFQVGKAWIVAKVDKDSNNVAISTSWYKNAGAANDWMVTNGIKIESSKAVVSWRAKTRDAEYRDGYKVYISEKGTDVADFDTSAPVLNISKENADWTQRSIDLSAYAGKTIYIAFVNDSKDKSALYVDDLFIGVPSIVGFNLDFDRVIDACGDVNITGTAFANGDASVNGFTVGFSCNGTTVTQDFNKTINKGGNTSFSIDKTVNMERNKTYDYTAWIKSGADSTGIKGKVSAYLWKVTCEEGTGTWCGYCVRGIAAMQKMRETYPNGYIGIAVHNDSSPSWPDSMAVGVKDYSDVLFEANGFSGYPHCTVNRNGMYTGDPGNIPDYYTKIKSTNKNDCGIEVTASYNESTGKISSNADFYFANDYDASKAKLVYVIIENNVHRTHAESGVADNKTNGYDQANYYAGGSMGECGGFENKPSTVKSDDMWYQDVARSIPSGYYGLSDVLPASIKEGGSCSYQYEMDMPKTVLKPENTELVVMLLTADGIVHNADKTAIKVISDGISNITNDSKTNDKYYYDLNGIRTEHPAKGIYIHNGKKVIL
jgi:microcystin-dependent protein